LAPCVTTIDWIVVGVVVLLALNGLRQGFIVSVLQLAGFAAGAFAGSRLGPLILSDGSHSPYAPLFALGGAVILGSLFAAVLEMAGLALRSTVQLPGLEAVDRGLGGLLGVALALGIAWIAGAAALQTPGLDLRRDVQRSKILAELNDVLPPSGFLLKALARFDSLPAIDGPGAEGVAPPTAAIARDPEVKAAFASTVRVLGTACGLGIEGSGWVAASGTVVTNAHVVAGEDDTIVQVQGSGARLDARVVAFDPTNDVAILKVAGLDAPALPIVESPEEDRAGAVLGYPNNGPYRVRAARLGRTHEVLSQDAYGNGPVKRVVTTFRGRVESGNSGGPVVDSAGRVLTTVFASAVGSGPLSGYGVPNSVVTERLAKAGSSEVSTGPCAR